MQITSDEEFSPAARGTEADPGLKEAFRPVIKFAIGAFLVLPLISLYKTFVLQNLWNWFAAEAFHLPEISFWLMYGIVLIIGALSPDHNNLEQEHNFKVLTTFLDACLPEEKREWVSQQFEDMDSSVWIDFGFNVFGKILNATWILVIGWVVHMFLV